MNKEIRILYVEDVPADVMMINHELRKGGLNFRAKRVDTKKDFVFELEQHAPDLIISDHGLPHFDGFAALAMAKEKCPQVPFIFVTGSLGEDMTIETFERGATDYVLKHNLGKLLPAVHRALREADERAELKQKEQALRESEERFRMLMEGVKDYAIVMLDAYGHITGWNSGAALIHGCRAEEAMGRHFDLFYPRANMKQGRPKLDLETAATKGRFEEEGIRVACNGKEFSAHVVITALYDPEGKLKGFAHVTRDISERKQAEALLRQSESLKSAILETALDAIISIDHQGRVQEWNPAAQKIFGYTRAEVLGQSVDEMIIPTAMWEVYHEGLTHYLINGAGSLLGRPIELTLRRKNGNEFPAELAISRVPTEEPPRCTALVRDITERRSTEAALRESRERYRMLVEGVKDYAIYMLDPAGCVASWNTNAERIEGYEAEDMLGKSYSRLFPETDIKRGWPAQILEKAAADGRCAYEGWQVRKDGSRFWSQGSIAALRDQTGQLLGFSKIGRDMTEQRKAEEGVRQLAAIVQSSDDAIFSKSLESVIDSWNPGAERLFGYTAKEIIGHSVLILIPSDRIREESHIIAQIKQGRTVPYFETLRRRKDGRQVDVSVTISPIKDSNGKVIGASQIARDITDRKHAEERLRQLNQELERRVQERTAQLEMSNRELEAFSYSVSHDLRAPLRHVLGYIEILQSEAGERLDESDRKTLQTITEAAQQMGQLIDALLAFSRMGRAEMRLLPVRLSTTVEEVRRELRNECKGRNIEWKVGKLPEVHGDPVMLRQVLINLLSNALKYSRPREQARIEIGAQAGAGETICFVRDNGVGFDMKYADKLFGVFQRLHRPGEFEGTGIGLANVRRIIQRHGGRTWAESAVDAGATFYFSLPLNPKEPA